MRKRLNFPELRGEVPQFVPETLEHPTLHFSDDQISLIPKIGDKIEKKYLYFKISFTPVPPLLASLSPNLCAKFVILLYLIVRLCVNHKLAIISFL